MFTGVRVDAIFERITLQIQGIYYVCLEFKILKFLSIVLVYSTKNM